MSDYSIHYSTGWYSVSPAFAWWNFDAHRVAAIKTRREAERVIEEDKQLFEFYNKYKDKNICN